MDAIEIKPDGLYLLRAKEHLSAEEVEQIIRDWKEYARDARCIVLDGGLQITELTDEQLAELGLRRV